jgi:hypothetical protein
MLSHVFLGTNNLARAEAFTGRSSPCSDGG